MQLFWCLVVALSLFLASASAQIEKSVRFVSWNVEDNKYMDGGFDLLVIRQLLGLQEYNVSEKAYFDIYAITLQENCYLCDNDKAHRFANIFLDLLNHEKHYIYDVVGQSRTRDSSTCESVACNTGQHGTTHLLIIAKRGMASYIDSFHVNKCSDGFFKNAEKGIAAVKFQVRGIGGPVVCIGGLHLDSDEPKARRECFQEFMQDFGGSWRRCDIAFFGGSFSTKTGKKGGSSRSRTLAKSDLDRLKYTDEMAGADPFGGRRLMDFIGSQNGVVFKEGAIDFFPTYSLKPTSECGGKWPCYRGDRPPSWTDRIICSGCKIYSYFTLPVQRGDHAPLIGIFTV